MERPSRVATAAAAIGVAGFALFAVVPIGIQLGLLPPSAFRVFLLGVLLGLVALVLGAVALWLTRPAAARAGRERALTGAALGFVIVATIAVLAGGAGGLPAINDITTSPDDPPVFVALLEAEGNAGRDMGYPGEEFAAAQREGYPDLGPIELDVPPGEALERIENAARALGWKIVDSDPKAGRLEATHTSRIFRFVDDVVVRIRPAPDGSVVDVRSKSRLGRGDLGANAERIRALGDAIR